MRTTQGTVRTSITVLIAVLATSCAPAESAVSERGIAPSRPDTTMLVRVTRPTIVGFFPPAVDSADASSDGYVEGVAHIEFALEDGIKCLGRDNADAYMVIDTAVRVQRGVEVDTVRFSRVDSLSYGVLLASSDGRRQVLSAFGPSQLISLTVEAIPGFFHRPPCG